MKTQIMKFAAAQSIPVINKTAIKILEQQNHILNKFIVLNINRQQEMLLTIEVSYRIRVNIRNVVIAQTYLQSC